MTIESQHLGMAEKQPITVETFAVLDMDRTLLDTGMVIERLCRQLEHHGISLRQINQDLDFIRRQTGQSFSLLDFLDAQYGTDLISVVKQEVQESVERGKDTDGLLCEGAQELIDVLERSDVPFAVLTFGERANQDFKLTLLRKLLGQSAAALHAVVTQVPNKAAWIADEWAYEGGFTVPAIIHKEARLWARQVVIIDDKAANLATADPSLKGILVDNSGGSEYTTQEVARRLNSGKSLREVANEWPVHDATVR